MAKKVHDYAFTIVRPSDPSRIFTELRLHPAVYGVFFGEEISPKTGVLHLQGYIWFYDPVSYSKAKRIIGNNAYVQRARKSPLANYEYCTKQGRQWWKQMPLDIIQEVWLVKQKQKILRRGEVPHESGGFGGLTERSEDPAPPTSPPL